MRVPLNPASSVRADFSGLGGVASFARASFEHLGHARFDMLTVTGRMECVDPSLSHFQKRFEEALFMGQALSDVSRSLGGNPPSERFIDPKVRSWMSICLA